MTVPPTTAVDGGTTSMGARPGMTRHWPRLRAIQVGTFGVAALVVLANAVDAVSSGGEIVTRAGAATGAAVAASAVGLWSVARRSGSALVESPPARLPRRVLAIGAHPDDLELACGGTLMRLVDVGHEVHAMVMSHGAAGGDGAARQREAVAGARFVGATSVEIFDMPDTQLSLHENEMAHAIEETIRRHQPDIVLTHSANDQHQDHRAVHLATLRAARRHPAILCYESPSVTAGFQPSVFVDIENHLDAKVRAVATHRDQRSKPYVSAEQIRGLATFRGSQARVRHAEGFEAVRMPAMLFGDV
jgi:LmbE family N-acetylglucosaminyl deacetylase